MRVGILTFCYAHNYGALLQCFAMRETLKKMGLEVDVIGYKYKEPDSQYIRFHPSWQEFRNPVKAIKKQIKQITYLPYHKENVRIWNEYEKFISEVIRPVPYPSSIKYEMVVCGSDQIWNPASLKGYRKEFFGIIENCNPVKVAYAPSCGNVDEIGDHLSELQQLSKQMDFLSAREEKLAIILSRSLKKEVQTLIDPSLLADRDIYKQLELPRIIKERYVLVYNKNGKPGVISDVGKYLGRKHGIKVYEITTLNAIAKSTSDYTRLNGVSCNQFLTLIRDAEYVVTDAFHGVAYSLSYERQFYFVECLRTERIYNLLTMLDLQKRAVKSPEDLISIGDIDYNKVSSTIASLREKALNYLSKAIDYSRTNKS